MFDEHHCSVFSSVKIFPKYVSNISSIFVSSAFVQISTDQINPALLQRAYNLHNSICEILLSSYESLQDFYETMLEQSPSNEDKPVHGESLMSGAI